MLYSALGEHVKRLELIRAEIDEAVSDARHAMKHKDVDAMVESYAVLKKLNFKLKSYS